ncbi:hypothetical protein Tco_0064720 [Tanacetum coccineum]
MVGERQREESDETTEGGMIERLRRDRGRECEGERDQEGEEKKKEREGDEGERKTSDRMREEGGENALGWYRDRVRRYAHWRECTSEEPSEEWSDVLDKRLRGT